MESATPYLTSDESPHIETGGYSFFDSVNTEMKIRSTNDFICDLSHVGFISARGPDARAFLNGQLTNDLENLPDSASQLTGYCSPKGRLFCIFRLLRNDDGFLLQTNRSVLSSTADRLQRYVLRAKVEIDIGTDSGSFGVVGIRSADALSALLGALPNQPDAVMQEAGATVICHELNPLPRYQVVGPAAVLQPLWGTLSRDHACIGSWGWGSLDIRHGLASVCHATTELFVPQFVNLDLVNAISFSKGCYPGQEIVARMHYLGKLKTRMILAHVASNGCAPQPGQKLFCTDQEQSVGTLVDATPAESGYDILTTVRIENLNNDLRLESVSGVQVSPANLPYALEKTDAAADGPPK